MAKKKKVVVSKKNKGTSTTVKKASPSLQNVKSTSRAAVALPFGKENYKWMLIGIFLIALGMILMIGGFNEDPNVWDESKIYGLRRTLLAPVVILTGLAIEIYAIFK